MNKEEMIIWIEDNLGFSKQIIENYTKNFNKKELENYIKKIEILQKNDDKINKK